MPFSVAFYLVPGFSMMALSAAVEPLRAANRLAGRRLYDVHVVGRDVGPIAASNGFEVFARYDLNRAPATDLTVVIASLGIETCFDKDLFAWLRGRGGAGRLLGAISNGSLVLARAGLLAGRQATIHWEMHRHLAEEHPDVNVSLSLYCVDGDVMTAAGGVSAMDMMLDLIARREGHDMAADVSEQFLHGPIRAPGQMQRQDIRWRYQISDERLVKAIRIMEDNLETPVRIGRIAEIIGLSERQVERRFVAAVRQTPSAFYIGLRIKKAHALLVSSTLGLEEIGAQCGFSSLGHFSRTYKLRRGRSPSEDRRPKTP